MITPMGLEQDLAGNKCCMDPLLSYAGLLAVLGEDTRESLYSFQFLLIVMEIIFML